jgi:hypothetical protein
VIEAVYHGFSNLSGLFIPEPAAGRSVWFGFESDRNGELGKAGWKALAGKSLRAEDIHLDGFHDLLSPTTETVTAVALEACGDDALESGVHAGGAKGDMAIVEEQAATKIVGLQLVEHHGGGDSGMEPGLAGDQAEEFEAQGLARLFFTGVDVE